MNTFTTILLALLAAALLGNVIGWCARRLVAIKNERRLTQQFAHEKRLMNEQLQDLAEENEILAEQLHDSTTRLEANDAELLSQRQSVVRSEAIEADLTQQVEGSQLELLRLEDELKETQSQVDKLEQQLQEQQTSNAGMAGHNRVRGSVNGDVDLPVLSRKHGPDILPEFSPVTSSGIAQDSMGSETAGRHNSSGPDRSSLDTGKYLFARSDQGEMQIDADILALSRTGSHDLHQESGDIDVAPGYDDAASSPESANTGSAGSSPSTDVPDPERNSSVNSDTDSNSSGRGLFSRFNKRKH